MAVLSALFGWLLPAKSQNLSEIDIRFSQEQVFTPAFVAKCAKPIGYSISFEDGDVILFENYDESIVIRLSSLKVHSETTSDPAYESIRDGLEKRTILLLDEVNRRALSLSNETKSDDDWVFYSAHLAENEIVILISVTLKKAQYLHNIETMGEFFRDYSRHVEIIHVTSADEKSAKKPEAIQLLSFSDDELSDFYLMRKHAGRLMAGMGLPYPPSAVELDDVFRRVVEEPAMFAGLDAAQQALGVALGDLLVSKFGFDWAYVEDEAGRDLAVVRNPMGTSTRVFPIDVVRKRSSPEEAGFISALVEGMPEFIAENN